MTRLGGSRRRFRRSVLLAAFGEARTMPSICRWRRRSTFGRSLRGIVVRAAQEQAVAASARHRLEAGDDLDEERVHQLGDHDPESVGAAQVRLRATAFGW